MNRRLLVATTAAFTCLSGLFTAGAATAAPSHPPVRIIGDCVHAQAKPHEVIIACGDGGIFFKDISYTRWNSHRAKGHAQLWVNTDDPNAAAGHYAKSDVTFVMDKPEHVDHQLRFSRIEVFYVDHGKHEHDFQYPPVRAISG